MHIVGYTDSVAFQTLRTCRWLFTISASLRSAWIGSVLQDFYQVNFLLFFLFQCACCWLFTPLFRFSLQTPYTYTVYASFVCSTVAYTQTRVPLWVFNVVYGECICVKRFTSLSFRRGLFVILRHFSFTLACTTCSTFTFSDSLVCNILELACDRFGSCSVRCWRNLFALLVFFFFCVNSYFQRRKKVKREKNTEHYLAQHHSVRNRFFFYIFSNHFSWLWSEKDRNI